MDESHDDQNFRCKIAKIWSKTCVFCCKKYPIPTCIVILLFVLYLFFPVVFKLLIYTLPLVGFSLLGHRVLSGANRQKIKHVEEDERRRKFAKSRRSFKSSRLIRQNTLKKSDDYIDTNDDDKDDIFGKSLHELLFDKKSKSIAAKGAAKGECSSSFSNGKVVKDVHHQVVVDKDDVEVDDDKRKDHNKIVRWTEDDRKNEMDLGLAEAERNKRLESLMVRRRSRKNLGFEEKGSTGNEHNVQISAVKTTKINPFLEDNSGGNKSPGSAPSYLPTASNPFDLPYDPHEEKLDLTGDNFHEEFTLGQPKEPVLSRHESFSLGALSHSVIAQDHKHERSYRKHLSDKKNSAVGFETSTLGKRADNEGDNNHIQQDGAFSDDSINSNHPKEDETEIKPQELDSYNARKADINFFYGSNKTVHHVVNHSIVSDMQVELSDEETNPTLDDLDIEKDRESLLNPQADSETNENPKPYNFIDEVQQSDNMLHQTNDDSRENLDNLQDQNVGQL